MNSFLTYSVKEFSTICIFQEEVASITTRPLAKEPNHVLMAQHLHNADLQKRYVYTKDTLMPLLNKYLAESSIIYVKKIHTVLVLFLVLFAVDRNETLQLSGRALCLISGSCRLFTFA